MSAVCARPVGFSGGVKCQRRARVRVSAVAAAPERERTTAATMYDVLSVGMAAGPDEIKAAYRRAALQWHPDACPGGADRFMRAREAYEVLSDPERRRGYDIQLRFGGVGGAGSSSPRGAARGFRGLGVAAGRAAVAGGGGARGDVGNRMRRAAAQPSPSH